MTNKQKIIIGAATATGVAAAAGLAYSAYNSRPMRVRRSIRRAGRTMDSVGNMLTNMAQITDPHTFGL